MREVFRFYSRFLQWTIHLHADFTCFYTDMQHNISTHDFREIFLHMLSGKHFCSNLKFIFLEIPTRKYLYSCLLLQYLQTHISNVHAELFLHPYKNLPGNIFRNAWGKIFQHIACWQIITHFFKGIICTYMVSGSVSRQNFLFVQACREIFLNMLYGIYFWTCLL